MHTRPHTRVLPDSRAHTRRLTRVRRCCLQEPAVENEPISRAEREGEDKSERARQRKAGTEGEKERIEARPAPGEVKDASEDKREEEDQEGGSGSRLVALSCRQRSEVKALWEMHHPKVCQPCIYLFLCSRFFFFSAVYFFLIRCFSPLLLLVRGWGKVGLKGVCVFVCILIFWWFILLSICGI